MGCAASSSASASGLRAVGGGGGGGGVALGSVRVRRVHSSAERDHLGFAKWPAFERYREEYYDEARAHRKRLWDAFLRKHNHVLPASRAHPQALHGYTGPKQVKQLCRMGIPMEHRASAWMTLSGARAAMHERPGYYQHLLQLHADETSVHTELIEKDLLRTFPHNPHFWTGGSMIEPLRRVLTAYSWHNHQVGYCQSLNFIAATMLLILSEEEAFWLLAALVERIVPDDYYTDSMLGVTCDQRVFADLAQQRMPAVCDAFNRISLDVSVLPTQWLLTLFSSVMYWEIVMRIWDALFCEGFKVIIRVSLALLEKHRVQLCTTDDLAQIFCVMKDLVSDVYDVDALFKIAFGGLGTLSRRTIVKLRAQHMPIVTQLYREAQDRRSRWHQAGPASPPSIGRMIKAQLRSADAVAEAKARLAAEQAGLAYNSAPSAVVPGPASAAASSSSLHGRGGGDGGDGDDDGAAGEAERRAAARVLSSAPASGVLRVQSIGESSSYDDDMSEQDREAMAALNAAGVGVDEADSGSQSPPLHTKSTVSIGAVSHALETDQRGRAHAHVHAPTASALDVPPEGRRVSVGGRASSASPHSRVSPTNVHGDVSSQPGVAVAGGDGVGGDDEDDAHRSARVHAFVSHVMSDDAVDSAHVHAHGDMRSAASAVDTSSAALHVSHVRTESGATNTQSSAAGGAADGEMHESLSPVSGMWGRATFPSPPAPSAAGAADDLHQLPQPPPQPHEEVSRLSVRADAPPGAAHEAWTTPTRVSVKLQGPVVPVAAVQPHEHVGFADAIAVATPDGTANGGADVHVALPGSIVSPMPRASVGRR